MEDYKERVIKERDDLSEKIYKLSDFMDTETYKKLRLVEKTLLVRQLTAMRKYISALNDRISLF